MRIYLWRPNDSEIEDYKISKDLYSLKEYIREEYGDDVKFNDYDGKICVEYDYDEVGYISKIKEV